VLVFLGGVAKIYPNLSDGAKKYQQAFMVPLLGMDSISILGDCAKKCQEGCHICSIQRAIHPKQCFQIA
jgi:hypothetical protein